METKAPVRVADLFGAMRFTPPTKRTRTNERFELLAYFCDKINPGRELTGRKPFTPKGLGSYIGKVTNRDLYYIKSDCEQAQKRGILFSAAFFNLINKYKGQTPRFPVKRSPSQIN